MLLLFALLGACVNADAPIDAADSAEILLEVEPGTSARGLGPHLAEHDLISSQWQWRLFLRQTDASCLKAGTFKVRRSMSLNEVIETLCGAPLSDNVPFTVVEGWRIRDIDRALTSKGFIEAGEYTALAESKGLELPFDVPSPTLEGYLYPETYMVDPPPRFELESLVRRQVETFKTRFLDVHGEAVEQGRGLAAVVIMASMLEREEPRPANRKQVAGILWKRIDAGWQLGVDATSRYTLENWNDRRAFLKKLRDPSDPYNTRLNKGLPPTPIGNPDLSSLEAAIQPVDSPYWYYLHDAQQAFHGARNGDEHEANRKKYDVW